MDTGRLLTILIPCRDAEATLPACLDSVAALRRPAGFDAVEVLVIDNRSLDRSPDIARERGVTLLACDRTGADATRNVGLAAARGDIVLCTDSDCTVEADWAERLCAVFDDHPNVGVVGGAIVPGRCESLAERHSARFHMLDQEYFTRGIPGLFPFAITANAGFRRAALDEAGVFHEGLYPAEDADLSWRLQWAGWHLAYEPRARVHHFHRATLLGYWRQVFSYGRATARLLARHRHRFDRRVWLGLYFVRDVRRALGRVPGALLMGRSRYERLEPLLDVLIRSADYSGRLVGSLESGVVVL